MGLLPTTLGTRPRLAVELRPEGVVAARSEDALALVTAVSHAELAPGTLTPGLRPGNIHARRETVAAVKRALETVALKERQTTLVVPDSAVRVLLLDFDQLPSKLDEALPIVRFRLKKLLPFEADDAVLSYQVQSSAKNLVRVLAVAIPKEVLREYESIVREAGFEPGAVLPSTLAACAGLPEQATATLLVNVGDTGVTTAIVQAGILLLHRTVDLAAEGLEDKIAEAVLAGDIAYTEPTPPAVASALPLVDPDLTAGEWAAQSPLQGYGVLDDHHIANGSVRSLADRIAEEAELDARLEAQAVAEVPRATSPPVPLTSDPQAYRAAVREVTQAVSVAAAYFEDTLLEPPGAVLSAGTLGAGALGEMLEEAGITQAQIRVLEAVDPAMLTGGATTTRIPRGWLAGVRGALRS